MGENRWRGYEDVARARRARGGGGTCKRGVASRAGRPPAADPDHGTTSRRAPSDPVPTIGGSTLLAPILRPGARDQRPNESRPDVLIYTSDALQQDYSPRSARSTPTLLAASSAPDTDFVVRLVDVHPDGRAIALTDGIIRASARESYPAPGVISPTSPTPIEPGRPYEFSVDLWATGITFLAGHRIRVEVTSSSFPRWGRNPNTGEDAARATRTKVARQQIFHGPAHPSHVSLTVVG